MLSRSFCLMDQPLRPGDMRPISIVSSLTILVALSQAVGARVALATPPAWMREQLTAPLPAHDEKTTAVVLYEERVLTVHSDGKITRLDRKVYKILRPDGEHYGSMAAVFNPERPVIELRGWCVSDHGKEFEANKRDAIDSGIPGVDATMLVTDVHMKTLHLSGVTPGSIVGFEVEQELGASHWTEDWYFQDLIPVREAHLALQLPSAWNYRVVWLNHAAAEPMSLGPGRWGWVVSDLSAIHIEQRMPAWHSLAGKISIMLLSPNSGVAWGWSDLGNWYTDIARGRRDASGDIKQKVLDLTASTSSTTDKIRALARFVQDDIRYVAVELGVGEYQPRPAADVFAHRYGDCKDKSTLLSSMLNQIGIESYYVLVNTNRGIVTAATPPGRSFNHVILAIHVPDRFEERAFRAMVEHPTLGHLLFFDPTNPFVALGDISGALQDSFGLLVVPDRSELIKLPRLPVESNAIQRTAKLTLDADGTLHGDVHETWMGDAATMQRASRWSATQATDEIKPVEAQVGTSFASVRILKASVGNLRVPEQPVIWHYSLQAAEYAKVTGGILIVRPRVLGSKTEGFLETGEPRQQPIEMDALKRDTDVFEITLPLGYNPDYLPSPANAVYDFGSYHSKTELIGNVLHYSRTFEIKQLTVPAKEADELKQFYRVIYNDERASAVLTHMAP
jgi:hypothetical protein